MADEAQTAGVPKSTSATRGRHFRELTFHRPATPIIAALIFAGALILGVNTSLAAGLGAGGGALLLMLLIVFVLAGLKAQKDFFSGYAKGRGLQWSDARQQLPPVTPLLTKGDERYSEETLTGALPGGLNGTLSYYTYEVETTDSKGNRQTSYYHFTVVLAEIPECTDHVKTVLCQRKSGFKFMEKAEDAFRKNERVKLESDAFDDRYELFIGPEDDQNWIRQLFEPSFIVWLTEGTPKKFAFELVNGNLCVNVTNHQDEATELDGVCEAAAKVAARLREESGEG